MYPLFRGGVADFEVNLKISSIHEVSIIRIKKLSHNHQHTKNPLDLIPDGKLHKWLTLGKPHKQSIFTIFLLQYFGRIFKKVGRLWGFPTTGNVLWTTSGRGQFFLRIIDIP